MGVCRLVGRCERHEQLRRRLPGGRTSGHSRGSRGVQTPAKREPLLGGRPQPLQQSRRRPGACRAPNHGGSARQRLNRRIRSCICNVYAWLLARSDCQQLRRRPRPPDKVTRPRGGRTDGHSKAEPLLGGRPQPPQQRRRRPGACRAPNQGGSARQRHHPRSRSRICNVYAWLLGRSEFRQLRRRPRPRRRGDPRPAGRGRKGAERSAQFGCRRGDRGGRPGRWQGTGREDIGASARAGASEASWRGVL
mmetsp:Transcript_41191/g.132603  ORF Transcript_41191/g.132603 Transcript_41191/m.132603 type:complete len:249 (-) Transcript_41191:368-1114(-)